MSIQVKICGINSTESADAAARAKADFVGMIFYSKSPRHVDFDQASALSSRLRGGPRLVAVFANADDSTIAEAVASAQPDYLQLHGHETPERAAQIAANFGLPLIKALPVAGGADLSAARHFEDIADFILFDAKAPTHAERPGGHGISFDWKLLAGIDLRLPWFLAGGLTAENVGRALRASGATMVDTSSGVETAPGRKSPEKIAEFVTAVRRAPHGDAT
jgi:phosphoribosylanthranilate isomerase